MRTNSLFIQRDPFREFESLFRQAFADRGQSGLVAEQGTNGDVGLAGGREPRPPM